MLEYHCDEKDLVALQGVPPVVTREEEFCCDFPITGLPCYEFPDSLNTAIIIDITPTDNKIAEPENPIRCVIARGGFRQYGTPFWILNTRAYFVAKILPSNKYIVFQGILDKRSSQDRAEFDKNGNPIRGSIIIIAAKGPLKLEKRRERENQYVLNGGRAKAIKTRQERKENGTAKKNNPASRFRGWRKNSKLKKNAA